MVIGQCSLIIGNSRLGRAAVPHLLQNFGGNLVRASRTRSDILEPPGQEILGLRLIPYPLANRPIHDRAGAGGQSALATLDELSRALEMLMVLVECRDEPRDSLTLRGNRREHWGVPAISRCRSLTSPPSAAALLRRRLGVVVRRDMRK